MTHSLIRPSLAALALAAGLATALAPALAKDPKGTSFVEDFDALDTGRWFVSDGWTNGKHQNCAWSKDQVSVADGTLRLGFAANGGDVAALKGGKGDGTNKDARAFDCGEVQTKAVFGYGTYEVRLKTPAGSGLNANMFSFIGPVHKKPHDEIDFEFLLKDTKSVQLNTYVSGKGGNEEIVPLPKASDAGFSDYAFVWEPGRVRWFIDGEQVRELADPKTVPSHESKIYLSLWGSDRMTGWLGAFETPAAPLAMEVDRVSFTGLGEACQFEGSVACRPDVVAATR